MVRLGRTDPGSIPGSPLGKFTLACLIGSVCVHTANQILYINVNDFVLVQLQGVSRARFSDRRIVRAHSNTQILNRGSSEVERWAHNPEVVGSKPILDITCLSSFCISGIMVLRLLAM